MYYTCLVLEVRLLGQFDARLEGEPVDIPSRPAQALLAYLMLTAGTPHRRERLAGLLWPDTAEANARSNLRHALWRLRGAIGGDQYIVADPLTVAFNVDADYWLDTEVLQQEFSGEWPVDELIKTVSVYNGDLLPGFYGDWVSLERERLQSAFERQMQILLDRLTAEGRWADVLTWGERWIALGGAPEPAYRALMMAYAGLGDMAGLATAYQRCADSLRNELGVEPSTQTRALYEQLSRGGTPPTASSPATPSTAAAATRPAEAITPGPATARTHNLPAQATPFIGRDEMLAEIARLLENPSCRLITLTGPGGIGKTRLALQAAYAHIDKFADGVFFVPLAPVGAADLIVPAIAHALTFSFYGGLDPTMQLLNHLRERRTLLVIDNFEHLMDGVGLLSEVLESASAVKILATSRERLNLRGEWLLAVEGMRVPENDRTNGIEAYSAMQLFLQSARRVYSNFSLSHDDKPHAVRICRLVEGMPLAIELASAWVRTISCHEIAREIERNLDFLATTLRDVPERHRSLRAVFDHSWNLLSPEEQRVFRSLSVFRGGFQREAAEEVANASLPLLSALMDKSLLRRNPAGRYEIHELLRQYARDKLAASDDESEVRSQHLAHFLRLAEEAEPRLRSADQLAWLNRLETEHDNLRVALKWSLSGGPIEAGLWLAGALARFWYWHGYWDEGRAWLEKLLSKSAQEADTRKLAPLLRARARSLCGAGWLADERGPDAALYEQSLALCREFGDKWGAAISLRGLGVVAANRDEKERAAELLNESLALFRELKDTWGEAVAHFNLGWLAYSHNDIEQTKGMWEQALALFRLVGERWGMAVTLGALAYLARADGDYKQSAAMSKSSLYLFKELGDKAGIAASLWRLASLAYRRSDYKQATELGEESMTLQKELGDRSGVVQTLGLLGLVAGYQGNFKRAEKLLEEALRSGAEISDKASLAYLRMYLALVKYFEGDTEQASTMWNEALSVFRGVDDKSSMSYTLHGLGLVALCRGDLEQAETLLQESLVLSRGGGDKRGVAAALSGLGRVADARGQYEQAVKLVKESFKMRREMGDKQGIAETLEGLASALSAFGGQMELEQAAQFFGAAERLREIIGAPLPPVERPVYERNVAAVRAQLDELAFSRAWAEGREMGLEKLSGEK